MTAKRFRSTRAQSRQAGATLVVSLIILAIVTVLGVASMRSSNLQLKMVASARDRAIALQRGEAALLQIEQQLFTNSYTVRNFTDSCNPNELTCFSQACTDGLCFFGTFADPLYKADCSLYSSASGAVSQAWQNGGFWDNTDRHDTIGIATTDGNESDVRYIVEFMCFAPRDDNTPQLSEDDLNSGVPLYRVTVRAQGEAGRSEVMMQSTVKIGN